METRTVYIRIDWNDIKSISAGERRKSFLENKGYTLMDTTSSISHSAMTYKLLDKA